ncbi:MAG: hypothetical protein MUC71_03545 [Steroidobacteraceae bacterium]|jgi:hypothetical protein|nr:hypothetical protein [Steroidobacteraceae bacterium]
MWRLAAPLLALAILAAHFFRAGSIALVVGCLALMALTAVPRRWAALAVQGGLALGALEWVRTLVVLSAARVAADAPATRMVAILATVAAVTALSILVFRHPRVAHFYPDRAREQAPR